MQDDMDAYGREPGDGMFLVGWQREQHGSEVEGTCELDSMKRILSSMSFSSFFMRALLRTS